MPFSAHMPVAVHFGPGCSRRAGELTAGLGRRAFVVTMADVAALGLAQGVEESLRAAGREVVVYPEARPEPKSGEIDAATAILRESGCDHVIGVGGGSAMDVAKAVALGARHPEPIWEYVNLSNRPPQPVDATLALPIVAVPTTAGTGSEATPFAVVTNTETVQKGTIKEPAIFPRVALVDPELSARMPARLTGATGIDAFAHALESYLNAERRTPFSDMLAERAMATLARALPRAFADGGDLEARGEVAWAATLAGMTISQAGTTVAHAIAQTLGARLGLSHAESVAMFTVATLRRTLPADAARIARIGRLIDPQLRLRSDLEPELCGRDEQLAAAEAAVDAVERLLTSVGMPARLSDFETSVERLHALADDLARDVTTYMSRPLRQHPVLFDADGIRRIVLDCI